MTADKNNIPHSCPHCGGIIFTRKVTAWDTFELSEDGILNFRRSEIDFNYEPEKFLCETCGEEAPDELGYLEINY